MTGRSGLRSSPKVHDSGLMILDSHLSIVIAVQPSIYGYFSGRFCWTLDFGLSIFACNHVCIMNGKVPKSC